jgi:hypothetical protein
MERIEKGLFESIDTPVETSYKLRKMRKELMPIINGAIDHKKYSEYPSFEPHVCPCTNSQTIQNKQVSQWFK